MKNFFKLMGIIALVAVIGFSMAACGGEEDNGGGGGGNLKKVSFTIVNNYSKAITHIRVVIPFGGSGGSDLTRYEKDVNIVVSGGTTTIEASVDFYPLMDDQTNFGIYFTYNDNSRVGMGIMGGWYQKFTDFPQTYTIAADGYNATDKSGKKVAMLDQEPQK